ncbi:hypothetical protein M409DRAFT_62873 [Zasmidium cellare ATCC 36951]|uniref:rRNA-processing protein EFG1 n=1 Tax=Zasmidium cellare ATCC 36951 TaxID=1080233 RepID=A0A6A6D4Q1_ZASCE|nr:uncharacterized protein M409DRAFT_62873 [Zasmidium cellare ATCC 36951]KAF2173350.1 hypothetical protein M409DRAFT_62873 [Zasmidium cellare ATCC 36951]
MATKRQAPSDSDARQQPPKRPKPSTSTPYHHQQRPAHHGKKSFKKAHPVNELKSTVRSLRRLLERSDDQLPAGIRIEKERALQTAERDLRDAEKAKKRSDVIGKFHKIRFFERQKAERRLKKARRAVREAEEEGEGEGDVEVGLLRRKVEDAEVDLNYAMFFPLEREYVSLFPTRRGEEESEGREGERQGDVEMWALVKRCMKEGTLADLRGGRLSASGERLKDEEEEEVARPAKKKKAGKVTSSKHVQNKDEEGESGDDQTGGGFFE